MPRRPVDLIKDEIKYHADQNQWFVEIPNSSNTAAIDSATAQAIERLKQEGFTVRTKQTDTKSPYPRERYVTEINIQRPKVINNATSTVFSSSLAPPYDPIANTASKVKTAIRSDPGSAHWDVALDAKNNPQEKDIKPIKDVLISEGFDVEYVPEWRSGYNETTPATLKIYRKDAAPVNMAFAAGVPLKKEIEYASLLKAGPSEKTAAKVKEAIRSDPSNSTWKVDLNFDKYTSERDIGAFIESIEEEGFKVNYVGERSHRNETIGPEIVINRGNAKPGKLPGREFCTLLKASPSTSKEPEKASPSNPKETPKSKKTKPASKVAEISAKSENIKKVDTAEMAKDSEVSKTSSEPSMPLDSSVVSNAPQTTTTPEASPVASAPQTPSAPEPSPVASAPQTPSAPEPSPVASAPQTPSAPEPSPVASAPQTPSASEPLVASGLPEPTAAEISMTPNVSETPIEPMPVMTEPPINMPPSSSPSFISSNQFVSDEPAIQMMAFTAELPQVVSNSVQSVDLTSDLIAAGNQASNVGKKTTQEGNSLPDLLCAELINKLCKAINEFVENQDFDKFVKACKSIANHEAIFQLHEKRLLSPGAKSSSEVRGELEKLKSTVDEFVKNYAPNSSPPFNTPEKAVPNKEQQQINKEGASEDDEPPLFRR